MWHIYAAKVVLAIGLWYNESVQKKGNNGDIMDNNKGSMNQKKTQNIEMIPQISTPTTRVYRADGKDCFVEVTSDALAIGKFKFTFKSYDASKPAGQRSKSTIQMYLDVADALLMSANILSGKYAKVIADEKRKYEEAKAKSETYFQAPVFVRMGGVSAKKLKIQGKERPDKMSLSRQIKLMGGMKAMFVIQAEQGPGEENDKGLIVPRYGPKQGTKAEQSVMIPLDEDSAKKLALMIQLYAQAYASAQYSALAMPVSKAVEPEKATEAPAAKNEAATSAHDDEPLTSQSEIDEDELPF